MEIMLIMKQKRPRPNLRKEEERAIERELNAWEPRIHSG